MAESTKKRKYNEDYKIDDIVNITKEIFLLFLDFNAIQNLLLTSSSFKTIFHIEWSQKAWWDMNYYLNDTYVFERSNMLNVKYFHEHVVKFKCQNLSDLDYLYLPRIIRNIENNKRIHNPIVLPNGTIDLRITNSTFYIEQLPPYLKTLKIYDLEQDSRLLVSLPESLTRLEIEFSDFNRKLELPPNLQILRFVYGAYNHLFTEFPSSLLYLELSERYNHFLDPSILPRNLTVLKFGLDYDFLFTNDYFANLQLLKTLKFKVFNQSFGIGFLPPGLIKLDLSFQFNQILLPNSLPITLKCLHFGQSHCDQETDFNQIIDKNALPTSLQCLVLGQGYKQALHLENLPNLKRLILHASEFQHNVLNYRSNLINIWHQDDREELIESILPFLEEYWKQKRDFIPCGDQCDCEK